MRQTRPSAPKPPRWARTSRFRIRTSGSPRPSAPSSGQLNTEYATEAAKLNTIGAFFKQAKDKGKTELLIDKHVSATDENANQLQEEAMKAMKTPVPIYTINVVEPGKTIGSSLWSFVYVDGQFRYAGKLKAVKPGASPLDELSKKDLKDALKGDDKGDDKGGW